MNLITLILKGDRDVIKIVCKLKRASCAEMEKGNCMPCLYQSIRSLVYESCWLHLYPIYFSVAFGIDDGHCCWPSNVETLFQGCCFRYASVSLSDSLKRIWGRGGKKRKRNYWRILLARNTRLHFVLAESDAFSNLTSQA